LAELSWERAMTISISISQSSEASITRSSEAGDTTEVTTQTNDVHVGLHTQAASGASVITVQTDESGHSVITGGEADDMIGGSAGEDIIDGAGRNDVMSGGLGADIFVISHDSGTDVVTDFVQGPDKIDVEDLGLAGFDQLSINGNVIDFGDGNTLTLDGIAAITEDDFLI
jgi:Ca2+-binding RTX toxin-like protein